MLRVTVFIAPPLPCFLPPSKSDAPLLLTDFLYIDSGTDGVPPLKLRPLVDFLEERFLSPCLLLVFSFTW